MIWAYAIIGCFFFTIILVMIVIAQKSNTSEKEWGFVICRHVHHPQVNQYWRECVRTIRRFHPTKKIVIIDDYSHPEYLDKAQEQQLLAADPHLTVIPSEYKGVGELLGYYYFHKHRWFEKAVILHDSVFLNSSLQKKVQGVHDVAFLWSFRERMYDDNEAIDRYLKCFPHHETLVAQKNSGQWVGCFGVMTVIRHGFLDRLVQKHQLFETLLPRIHCREHRMAVERVLSILIHAQQPQVDSLFGDIHDYCTWGHSYQDYKDKKLDALPLIKVWTGR